MAYGDGFSPPPTPFGVIEFYCRNQIEHLPTSAIAANQTVSSEGVIGFTGTAGGDTSENGGLPITLVDISTVTDADPTVSIANSGIPLSAGRYELLTEYYGNQTPDDDLHIRCMEVMSGSDDIVKIAGTQRQRNFIGTGANDIHAHYEIFRKFRLYADTVIYFRLFNYASNRNRIVGYIQIEKTAN